jgi:hypothetical protein
MRLHIMTPDMTAAYGIRPHSNILFAIGAATLFRNCSRIFGSLFSSPTTFCFVAACCGSVISNPHSEFYPAAYRLDLSKLTGQHSEPNH